MISQLRPEPKRLWLEALRSGNYDQTKGALRDEDGYCCLGVLCEVAIKAGVNVDIGPPDEYDEFRWRFDGETDLPPDAVTEWAFGNATAELNLVVDDPEVDGRQFEDELTSLNDTSGWTFAQIADAIEEQL